MRRNLTKRMAVLPLMAVAGLVLAGCGGSVNDAASETATTDAATDAATEAATEEAVETVACGNVAIAMHGWVGYTASAQVVAEVAKNALGCTVEQTQLEEAGVTYDAMEAGSIDVIVEDWGGGRWQEWVDRGAIQEVGTNGNIGLIGMYVPQWMADEYPDITDGTKLNEYAELFQTPETGDKGAWYEGPPGYTTIGEKIIEAYGLNYKVVSTGSEAALIELFTQATDNKTAALGYFYEPQNFLAQVPLARINWPASDWTAPEDADGMTDYPESPLIKLATTEIMSSGSPFATLLTNFSWTNADQNAVAADIEGGMTPEEAAQKWIDANKDTVNGWLAGTGASIS